jgi:hypothetical protein
MAYTDGSKVDQKNNETGTVTKLTGTGMYVPKQDGPYGIGGMMGQGKRTSLRPGPPGYTNTITRAELVGVYEFLKWAKQDHQHLSVIPSLGGDVING